MKLCGFQAATLMAENTDRKKRELFSFQAEATILAGDQNGLCHDWIKLQIIPIQHLSDVDVFKNQHMNNFIPLESLGRPGFKDPVSLVGRQQ